VARRPLNDKAVTLNIDQGDAGDEATSEASMDSVDIRSARLPGELDRQLGHSIRASF